MPEPRDLPILFSGDMVLAILAGRKTQTRRLHEKPRYAVGDRLWVREAWDIPIVDPDYLADIKYKADGGNFFSQTRGERMGWRPSIHMPRWASRISLRVLAVRQEPLRDMTPEDARAEGVVDALFPKGTFAELWDCLNGKRAPWASNPTVCVYTFERIDNNA
jgi:hypothetical protein